MQSNGVYMDLKDKDIGLGWPEPALRATVVMWILFYMVSKNIGMVISILLRNKTKQNKK